MKSISGFFALLLAAGLLAATPADAAEIFKCKDENGKVKYQSQPCKDAATQERMRIEDGPRATASNADANDSDSGKSKLDIMIENAEDPRIKRQLELRKQRCDAVRANLASYDQEGTLVMKDEDGKERVLTEEDIEAERKRARDFLEKNCK